jgi:hypothetical protein
MLSDLINTLYCDVDILFIYYAYTCICPPSSWRSLEKLGKVIVHIEI